MDKILKTLETIKVPTLSGSDANIPGTIISAVVAAGDSVKTKKKERISHCRSVTDAICLASVQGLQDYHKILESVVEVLFQLASDPDSDIRLVAAECLNRLVRTLLDSQQPKLHMEIYKEIRRNQSSKSLRTALGMFSHISAHIKPHKCRAFFASLLPCFVQISKRTEEYLYENLATYFSDIFRNLGPFAQDHEIKLLCKEYVTNLESSSAIIRRASASILVSICQNSRKSHIFLPKLIHQVTGLLKPKIMEKSVSSIIGSLQCIRHTIPPLYKIIDSSNEFSNFELPNVISQLVQVYEMCIILCNHDDHNVVTTSLETLQQLLTDIVEPLRARLTSPDGIENSIDNSAGTENIPPQSASLRSQALSIDSEYDPSQFPDESQELLENESDILKFRSFLSSSASESKDMESDVLMLSRRNSDITLEEDTVIEDVDSSSEVFHHSEDEQSLKLTDAVLQNFPELQIGSLYERNPPIQYCARFLAYNFLLAGQKGYQKPDSEVRISVKVLAINCLANLVKISGDIFFLALSHCPVEIEKDDLDTQTIEDVCLYASHNDPLLRGCTYVLVGAVVENLSAKKSSDSDLSTWIAVLKNGLLDAHNIGVKCALAAVNRCLGKLWNSDHAIQAEELLTVSLQVASNPYWLVKVDLIDLLGGIEWSVAVNTRVRKQHVLNIIMEYLKDEDIRVRNAAIACLPKYLNASTTTNSWDPVRFGVLCPQCIVKDINVALDATYQTIQECQVCNKAGADMAYSLEDVLNKLLSAIASSDNKNLFMGYQGAIAYLSETHSPKQFKIQWHLKNRINDSRLVLGLYLDLLRSSPFISDMNVHQSIIKIVCNLLLASDFYDRTTAKGRSFEEGNPFLSNNTNVCTYGTAFIQHVIAVLKLYQNVVDQSSNVSGSRKTSTSPVISPVKKFSQKLEAEKKASESETDKKAKGPYFSAALCPLHMRKINDAINQAWRVYRCSLEPSAAARFTSLLTVCLDVLGRMFLLIRSDYPGMSTLIEDILVVTNSIFRFCPADALKCIRRVLHSIFAGYNSDNSSSMLQFSEYGPRERFPLFLYPGQLLRLPEEEKPSTLSRSSSEVSSLGSFIRQFEPAVVSGLRVYTTTSDTMVQVEVLRLLKELIQGHVNYGLVDSNQVFLGFVIKQITFLEEGQIRDSNLLTEEMFKFFTLLSHEHQSTKSFIDMPKILNLCDILISSEYGRSGGIKSLMPVALDLVVKRFKSDNTNWEKKESSSHADSFLQLIMKIIKNPDVLPVLWMILYGRQQRQESKWIDDSLAILKTLVPAIEDGSLKIRTKAAFSCLIATLCALHKDSLPPMEELLTKLEKFLAEKIQSLGQAQSWMCTVLSYWILIVKSSTDEDKVFLESLTGGIILKTILKMMETLKTYQPISESPTTKNLFVQQFGTLTYSTLFLLQADGNEDLKLEMQSREVIEDILKLTEMINCIPEREQVLRICCLDLLSGISLSKSNVLNNFLHPKVSQNQNFLTDAVLIVIKDLNEGDVPNVEEWVILKHTERVLKVLNTEAGSVFLNRLSKYRKGQLLESIKDIVCKKTLDEATSENVIRFLRVVCDEFTCEAACIGVELLQRLKSPYLELDLSQFICQALHQIHTRKLLLAHKDRDVIKSYIESSSVHSRFPRLNMLGSAVLGDSISKETHQLNKTVISMISQWCCEDVASIEGQALAKMLGSLNYTQIMKIFSQPNFNLKVLQSCFVHLYNLFVMDIVDKNDVISLFTSDSRSSLMEKWALGVACVEFLVDKLDSWEHHVSDDLLSNFEAHSHDVEFLDQLPLMWECLTAMLRLKKAVITNKEPDEKGCYNNFIPTRIFTISFQYILTHGDKRSTVKCVPVQLLRTFLRFASAAFSDSSFVTFFNVRDNPQHIFTCVKSLQRLVEQLVASLRIDWSYNRDNSDKDVDLEIDMECTNVLSDFDYLMDFVFQVRCEYVQLDNSIFEPLRNVISGLGRCELINGWILISHLRWKPQASWKSQIFPPIEPIPLEILRNDHELLLQYIFKLNVFGVASRMQFEENWVIFLSVINLYVDENFQLQIVSAGLKALSMLLQQSVSISYTDKPYNEELNTLILKIDEIMDDLEPTLCKQIGFPSLLSESTKVTNNPHGLDVNSCIRFLTDLYTQWLQNPQGKMPLLLLSEVVRSIVVLSEYFEDNSQFQWMYETLMEVYKSFEKEDEVLWSHLLYGIFYSASRLELEAEQTTALAQILESSMTSPYANVSITSLKCGLVYLQHHPESLIILTVLAPYVLKLTQLDETSKDAESHSFEVWKILLFIWIHGPSEGFGAADFDQETIRNILTVLSPINKAYVSVRLLVLKALRKKVLSKELKSDVRKKIIKVAYETLNTANTSIFTEALKLYTTIFYVDFFQFRKLSDLDPEVLMPMAERTDVLFQLLKSGNKCNNQSVSKVLSLFILDFLPPSEILNRVIAEFMSPHQTAPELLAPVLAQVFEKARRKPKEAALLKEWILASLPNFLNSADIARTMWSLTLFFIGVSTSPEVASLLPFACLRRRASQIQQLFIHSALDLYGTLDENRSKEFRSTLLRNVEVGKDSNPFSILHDLLNQADDQRNVWAIDSCASTP